MEADLSAGIRLAIMLVIIGALVALVFTIFGFVRGATADGLTSTQNSIDAMTLAQFEDYDQKIMSGAQVKSALTLFSGRPLGLVVVNIRPNRAASDSGPADFDARFPRPTTDQPSQIGGIARGPRGNSGADYQNPADDVGILKQDGSEIGWVGYNYGALYQWRQGEVDENVRPRADRDSNIPIVYFVGMQSGDFGAASPALALGQLIDTWGLHREPTSSYYVGNLHVRADGSNTHNNNIGGVNKSGVNEFVRSSARYMARLSRDTNGGISGVVFVQIS